MSKTKEKKTNRTFLCEINTLSWPETYDLSPLFYIWPWARYLECNNSCLLLPHISFPVTSQGLHLLSASVTYKNKALELSWGFLISRLQATWTGDGLGVLWSSLLGTEHDLYTLERRSTHTGESCDKYKVRDHGGLHQRSEPNMWQL